MGQWTGWKAVVGAILIVGLAGLGMWAKFQPHIISSGTWDLRPGFFMYCGIQLTESGKLKAEFIEQPGSTGPYEVYLVDEADKVKLAGPDADKVQKLNRVEGTGTVNFPPTSLNSGKYYVIAATLGPDKVSVKYKVEGMK